MSTLASLIMPKAASPVDLPTPSPVAQMPTLNSKETVEARRKKLADIKATKGRDSTILDTGGASYTNTALGQ